MTDDNASFWAFSLKAFAKPPVAQACLDLQDRLGVDVNVLLFLLWCARRGRRLSMRDVGNVVTLVEGLVIIALAGRRFVAERRST